MPDRRPNLLPCNDNRLDERLSNIIAYPTSAYQHLLEAVRQSSHTTSEDRASKITDGMVSVDIRNFGTTDDEVGDKATYVKVVHGLQI